MGTNIITKTDREMEDRMLSVSSDPERADTLAKARAFKRTWIELAEALARVQQGNAWERWGFADFDAYCRKELHMRSSTVAKLLGSFRFLESSAPRVIERARGPERDLAPMPSMASVEFVKKATDRNAADQETLESMHHMAFDEGVEAPLLAKKFKDVAFPMTPTDKREKQRAAITQTARRLSALIAEDGSPVPKKLAIQVEELVGELLHTLEN
jgi:hypothetical protein